MPPKILIVDNEIEDRNKLGEGLQKSGFAVAYAATAREGMSVAITRCPDLIITELMLPDVDGFGLLEILKETSLTSQIPVVVLSEWASDESRRTCLKSGAAKFFPKPCTAVQLIPQLPISVRRRKRSSQRGNRTRRAS